MQNKNQLIISIFIILLVAFSIYNYNKSSPEKPIEEIQNLSCEAIQDTYNFKANQYNHCAKDNDCMVFESMYSCAIPINKDRDIEHLKKLENTALEKQCPFELFDCYTKDLTVACQNKKCALN